MFRTIKLSIITIIFLPFFSCSQAEDEVEEYLFEIEHTDTIITNKSDSLSHDSTTVSPSDSLQKQDNTISYTKDTIIVSYEKYMNLSPTVVSPQGAACYDKYLVQGYKKNPALEIYDLDNKKYLCKIDISDPVPSSDIHTNTICFGNQKYSPDDFFPILYINSGNTKRINGILCSFLYVYRLRMNDDNQMGIDLIQTITLKNFNIWTEGILDNDHNYLWVKHNRTFSSFHIPKLEEGDVTIDLNDALNDFSISSQPFKSSNQGHLYYNEKILLVSGIAPPAEKIVFMIINTLTGVRELVIDLNEIGIKGEPESVFFYKNQFMIGYAGVIYKFSIRKISGDIIL